MLMHYITLACLWLNASNAMTLICLIEYNMIVIQIEYNLIMHNNVLWWWWYQPTNEWTNLMNQMNHINYMNEMKCNDIIYY